MVAGTRFEPEAEGEKRWMPFRQVVAGPEGRRYVVTADRVLSRTRPLASLLAGSGFVTDAGAEADDEWEVRVASTAGERVFAAASGEVAERLMVLLGEEIELGLLEV
jgi:hypothetical protein